MKQRKERLAFLSDSKNLVPPRRKALREHALPHAPIARNPLHREDERIASENMVDGIHDGHEPRLPLVFVKRHLTKEVSLHQRQRGNPAQRDGLTCH